MTPTRTLLALAALLALAGALYAAGVVGNSTSPATEKLQDPGY